MLVFYPNVNLTNKFSLDLAFKITSWVGNMVWVGTEFITCLDVHDVDIFIWAGNLLIYYSQWGEIGRDLMHTIDLTLVDGKKKKTNQTQKKLFSPQVYFCP